MLGVTEGNKGADDAALTRMRKHTPAVNPQGSNRGVRN
jgi:hypothetical protein